MMKATKYKEWVCPKGVHQARITDACITKPQGHQTEEEVIRIDFQLTMLQHPLKVYLAKKTYRLRELHKFIEDFTKIVGEETLTQMFNMDSELIPESLSVLNRQEVDIQISHLRKEPYTDPYCYVSKIEPCGALVPDLDYAV